MALTVLYAGFVLSKTLSRCNYADMDNLTVQRIEHVKGAPTLDVLVYLARALQLPLRELMDFEAAAFG